MEFVTTNYSSMTIHEGLNDIPRIILRFNDSKQYGYSGGIQEIEIEGYKGFIDKIVEKDLYIKFIDPKIFQTFESKYLGNSLINAINSLKLKPNITGTFQHDIDQDFYMIRETPWHAFIRLSKYLPKEYYMACLCDKIKIFKIPDEGSFKELHISNYRTEADYSIEYNKLIIEMNNNSKESNPSYGGLISVPLSKMLKEDITTRGTDIINNYLSHYKNRDSYFSENLLFQSITPNISIGDGFKIDNANFMVISKSVTIGSTGITNGAYRCIKVS